MTGDLNIRDSFWDPNFPYHSSHRDTFFDIADFFSEKSPNWLNSFLPDTLIMLKTQTQF